MHFQSERWIMRSSEFAPQQQQLGGRLCSCQPPIGFTFPALLAHGGATHSVTHSSDNVQPPSQRPAGPRWCWGWWSLSTVSITQQLWWVQRLPPSGSHYEHLQGVWSGSRGRIPLTWSTGKGPLLFILYIIYYFIITAYCMLHAVVCRPKY